IPVQDPLHYGKIQRVVYNISENSKSRMTPEYFDFQMKENGISMVDSREVIIKHRKELESIYENYPDLPNSKEAFENGSKLISAVWDFKRKSPSETSGFEEKYFQNLSYLSTKDRERINDNKRMADTRMNSAVNSDNESEIKHIYSI